MRAMAKLRPHVDAFFDKVTVNVADGADKEKLRENRLKLLNEHPRGHGHGRGFLAHRRIVPRCHARVGGHPVIANLTI